MIWALMIISWLFGICCYVLDVRMATIWEWDGVQQLVVVSYALDITGIDPVEESDF